MPDGGPVVIVVPSPFVAFRIDEIEVAGDPADWIIDEIWIHRRQILEKSVPATEFHPGGKFYQYPLETLQTGMDLQICVRYAGSNALGEPFDAVAKGLAVLESRG